MFVIGGTANDFYIFLFKCILYLKVDSNVICFTDDTTLIIKDINPHIFKNEYDIFKIFFHTLIIHVFKFNLNKTEYIVFNV